MYHAGEIKAQTLAGLQETANRISRIILPKMPPVAEEFLSMQNMIVVGTKDVHEHMWVTPFGGKAGFVHATDPQTIQVDTLPVARDPIYENLDKDEPIGFIAADFVTHRRMRVNGTGHLIQKGLVINCNEVYSNCGKYIQTRKPTFLLHRVASPPCEKPVNHIVDNSLTETERNWIRTADTFFISSSHPEVGADVSHKGGNPGFVQVVSDTELVFPDYIGNSMFNTIGNILVNPNVGLLFLDFTHGHTLQLTGKAEATFETEKRREVLVTIEKIIEVSYALPLSFEFIDYAKTNPKLQ